MNLSPLPIQKFFDNNGAPLTGGLLYTYVAGTTTKLATYTDSTGGTPNTNPIVLNYRGEANVWLDQALTYKFTLAPVGDTDPPTKPIWTVDNIAAGITLASLTAQIIGKILWPRTSAEIAAGVTPANYAYEPYNLLRYGAVGDGITDDSAAIASFFAAIPTDGIGFIPPAASYYKLTASINRNTRVSISGGGLASRIHYTGTGTALTLSDARFCTFFNWYLSGTNSASAGGVWFQKGQGDVQLFAFFTDGFTGAGGWAWRFSDCWDVTAIGGCARQSRKGVWCDTTNLGAGGICNQMAYFGVDMSECETSVDFQSGQGLTLISCDFGNGGAVITPLRAVEFARGLSGAQFADTCSVSKCWFEGAGSGVVIGRNNTSSSTPSKVIVNGNHIDVASEMLRINKGDLCTIGENSWGVGSITIDAGVTRTLVETVNSITDNSTAGQTSYIRQSSVEVPSVIARGDLQSGMNRLRVTRNGVTQSINSGAPTKIQWTTVDLDSPAAFDNTTNYRWTPTKSGWYSIRAAVVMDAMTDGNFIQLSIYKNGSRHRLTNYYCAAAGNPTVQVDAMCQANGSTDYFEIFVEHNNGVARNADGAVDSTWFEGHPAV